MAPNHASPPAAQAARPPAKLRSRPARAEVPLICCLCSIRNDQSLRHRSLAPPIHPTKLQNDIKATLDRLLPRQSLLFDYARLKATTGLGLATTLRLHTHDVALITSPCPLCIDLNDCSKPGAASSLSSSTRQEHLEDIIREQGRPPQLASLPRTACPTWSSVERR